MSSPKVITIAEAKQAKAALETEIRNLLAQFSVETGAQIYSVYVRPTEFFVFDNTVAVDYSVEIEVKL